MSTTKTTKRIARHARIRARVRGTEARPRLAVFRSNKFLYAQLINDDAGTTLAAVDTRGSKAASATERAQEAAKALVEKAKSANVSAVVFDRGGFPYHGTIAIFADAAREAGLQF